MDWMGLRYLKLSVAVAGFALILGVTPLYAAVVTGGASQAPDVFDVAGLTPSLTGDPNIFAFPALSANLIVNDRNDEGFQVRITTNPPSSATGRVTYTVPAPVTVGTLFTVRSVASSWIGASPITVSLDGGGVIFQNAGLNDNLGRLHITNLPVTVNTTAVNIDMVMREVAGQPAGDLYASTGNAWITTEKQYIPIPVEDAGVTLDKPSQFGAPSLLVNKQLDGSYALNDTVNGPFGDGGVNSPFEVYIDMGVLGQDDLHLVSGLLVSGRNDHFAEFEIFTGDGTVWSSTSSGRVEMGFQEFIVVEFDQPLLTSHLMLQMDPNDSWLLNKVIPLRDAPEPGTACLITATLLAAAARRSRRTTGKNRMMRG